MSSSISLAAALIVVAGFASSLCAQNTSVARYEFTNQTLVSTDSDALSEAAPIAPQRAIQYWQQSSTGRYALCLTQAWVETTEQSPANGSTNYMQLTVTPAPGKTVSLATLRVLSHEHNNADQVQPVNQMAVYADEVPGAAGDNYSTKLAQVNIYAQTNVNDQWYDVDLSGVSFLQGITSPVSVRLYFWHDGMPGAGSGEIFEIKLLSSQKSSLGNFVWIDGDCDGVQDSNEGGLAGVQVDLYDVNGSNPNTPVQSTSTDSNGHYAFCVDAGTYRVGFTTPSGYIVTDPNQGNDPALDSDAPLGFLISAPVGISPRESRTDVDAGFCACPGVAAVATSAGLSCFQPLDPVLTANQPVLGTQTTVHMDSAFPNALLLPFFSFGPVTPFQIGNTGCFVYVDAFNPGNLFMPGSFFTDQNGDWEMTFILPNDPMLAGLEFVFQVRVCAPNGPAGPLAPDWASNGLFIRLGCP